MDEARIQAVERVLERAEELKAGERVARLVQLLGGWSRHSFVATLEPAGGAPRKYIVRCKPAGALLDTDLSLEYDIYQSLRRAGLPVPRVFGLEVAEDSGFDGPFFVMEFVEGRVYNIFKRADQQALIENWNGSRSIASDLVKYLVEIHGLPRDALPENLPELSSAQVLVHWKGIYEKHCLARDPVAEEAFAWLEERLPAAGHVGLIHGDYRIGNTLVAGGRIRTILDWELSFVGDVRFDLGYLALEREAGKHLTQRSSLFACVCEEEWFYEEYERWSGRPVDRDDIRAFQMLTITMLLGTQYMASWMYAQGKTMDFRMAWSRFSFPGLRQDMIRLMDW